MDVVASFACLAYAASNGVQGVTSNCGDKGFLWDGGCSSSENLNKPKELESEGAEEVKDSRSHLVRQRILVAEGSRPSLSCCSYLLEEVSNCVSSSCQSFRPTCLGHSGEESAVSCSSSSLSPAEAIMKRDGECAEGWEPHHSRKSISALSLRNAEEAQIRGLKFQHRMCTIFRLLQKGAWRFPVMRQWLWESYAAIPSSEALIIWSIEAAEREEVKTLVSSLSIPQNCASKGFSNTRDNPAPGNKCLCEASHQWTAESTVPLLECEKHLPDSFYFPRSHSKMESMATDVISQSSNSKDAVELRNCLLHLVGPPPPLKVLPPLFVMYVLSLNTERRQSTLLLPLCLPQKNCQSVQLACHEKLIKTSTDSRPYTNVVLNGVSKIPSLHSLMSCQPHKSNDPNGLLPIIEIYYGWNPAQTRTLNDCYFAQVAILRFQRSQRDVTVMF